MSLLDRLDARAARPYGDCPLSAHCWAHDLNDPADPAACAGCWQHDLGTPWAAEMREAAKWWAFATHEERMALADTARAVLDDLAKEKTR